MDTLREDQYTFMIILSLFFFDEKCFYTKVVEKIKTHILCSITPPNHTFYDIMWKNIVVLDKTQMTVWHVHFMLDT